MSPIVNTVMADGFSRDVGRQQLPGLAVPRMEIDVDETKVRLADGDLSNMFRQLCGRVNIAPGSMTWYDGTILTLASITLSVTGLPFQGEAQFVNFHESGTMDLVASSRNKRYDPTANYDTCIQFGSKMSVGSGIACYPFAVRMPVKACVVGGSRSFSYIAKALYVRNGPASPSAPAQLEICSNEVTVPFGHAFGR